MFILFLNLAFSLAHCVKEHDFIFTIIYLELLNQYKDNESNMHPRMKDFYEKYWQHRINTHYIHTQNGMWIPQRVYAAFGMINASSKPISVLDIGCGEGTLGKMLKDRMGDRVFMMGLDISSTALKMASAFYDKVAEFDADTDSLGQVLEQKKFDYIVAMEMLEHLFNPKRALEQFKMALAEEGCLIASVPNMVHWKYRIQYLTGHLPGENTTYDIGEHLQNFTYFSFKKLVEEVGCRVIDIDGHFQIPLARVMPSRLKKYLGKALPNLFGYQVVLKLQANKIPAV
jgi:2-polyprenyl-3-methyl-5-hydroxy-6-metoxy-1,4-benzoquinol methylase